MSAYDVFISYARDEQHLAEPLRAQLEELGLKIFFDLEGGIVTGDEFPKRITNAIDNTKAVLACWTPYSLSRDWCRKECLLASQLGKLAPVALQPLEPLQLGSEFINISYAAMTDYRGEGENLGWSEALKAIARLMDAWAETNAQDEQVPNVIARAARVRAYALRVRPPLPTQAVQAPIMSPRTLGEEGLRQAAKAWDEIEGRVTLAEARQFRADHDDRFLVSLHYRIDGKIRALEAEEAVRLKAEEKSRAAAAEAARFAEVERLRPQRDAEKLALAAEAMAEIRRLKSATGLQRIVNLRNEDEISGFVWRLVFGTSVTVSVIVSAIVSPFIGQYLRQYLPGNEFALLIGNPPWAHTTLPAFFFAALSAGLLSLLVSKPPESIGLTSEERKDVLSKLETGKAALKDLTRRLSSLQTPAILGETQELRAFGGLKKMITEAKIISKLSNGRLVLKGLYSHPLRDFLLAFVGIAIGGALIGVFSGLFVEYALPVISATGRYLINMMFSPVLFSFGIATWFGLGPFPIWVVGIACATVLACVVALVVWFVNDVEEEQAKRIGGGYLLLAFCWWNIALLIEQFSAWKPVTDMFKVVLG